ncbi:MAG: acyl carrier protein [Pseudomonadota bacterium]
MSEAVIEQRQMNGSLKSNEIASRIQSFLEEQGIDTAGATDVRQTPLLEGDALDSLGVVQLTVFLGDAYDVAIDDDDFVAENFATIGSLSDLIAAKIEGR